MSLNFSFANVRDHEQVTTSPFDPEQWHPVANGLVWLSMICGYREITDKNHAEIALRINAYQMAIGPYLSGNKGKGVYITPVDVQRFIGMTTNATTMTKAQWEKHLGAIVMREAVHYKPPQEKSGLEVATELASAKAAA